MSEISTVNMPFNEYVEWSVQDETGILTLNNPPQNYLVKPAFVSQALLEKEVSSSGIKGIIIHGKGRHFSAGADIDELKKMANSQDLLQQEMSLGKDLLNYIEQLPIPVISAVRGACFGGGLEIALASHIIICAETSLFAFPEINAGIMTGLGGTLRLSRRTGIPEAMVVMLSGDIVDAETALSLKIVDRVVTAKEVFDTAFGLMKKMISGRKVKVINSIVRSINNSRNLSLEQAMHEETRMFCALAVDEIFRNKEEENER